MDDHIKLPFLASLRSSGPFAFLNGETSDVTTTVQMAIYPTLNYQGTIKEHYVEMISVRKLVRTELSAPNTMEALMKFFDKIDVSLPQAHFYCMDNTNVNYKLGLCFKHLLKEFPCVAEFDVMLLSL